MNKSKLEINDLKITLILTILKDMDYRTWKSIVNVIEKEYIRQANKNVPKDLETLYKNIMHEIN